MIVTCPSCSKRYMLDEALLPQLGRQVRCVACQHTWLQKPEEKLSSTFQSPLFVGEKPPLQNPRPTKKSITGFGWMLLILLAMSVAFLVVIKRNQVIGIYPESKKFFKLLGLQVNPPGTGLSIVNASPLLEYENGGENIRVAGDLINTTDNVHSIPPLKIKLEGDPTSPDCQGKDCVLGSWEHHLSENSLLPGEKIHFETTPHPKIEGTHHISIEF